VLSPLGLLIALAAFGLKALAFYSLAAVVENGMARMRYVLAPNAIWLALGMALLSFVFYLAQA
jgi:hydrogenase-4 component C